MKSVIPINPCTDGSARTIKAQYYKNSLRNLELRGGRGCTGVVKVYEIHHTEIRR